MADPFKIMGRLRPRLVIKQPLFDTMHMLYHCYYKTNQFVAITIANKGCAHIMSQFFEAKLTTPPPCHTMPHKHILHSDNYVSPPPPAQNV